MYANFHGAFEEDDNLNGSKNVLFDQDIPEIAFPLPQWKDRVLNLAIGNPFADNGFSQHPRFGRLKPTTRLNEDGTVDGLIKFRVMPKEKEKQTPPKALTHLNPFTRRKSSPAPVDPVTYLPPDFGRGIKLDYMDIMLFKFYIVAFCPGRTLVPNGNPFLTELAQMAARNECVRHALLALAASYVLDYQPSDKLQCRANMHHKRAVTLLGKDLENEDWYQPGKEDGIIGSLMLLSHDDSVNWEFDRQSMSHPKWYRGSKTAEHILDSSDPGFRYLHPVNVQMTIARRSVGNLIGLYSISSATISPLDLEAKKPQFSWLVEGNDREQRKIEGSTGMCPKLLQTFAQITHLSARLYIDPSSMMTLKVGNALLKRLQNFRQCSDFTEGYESPEALLASCELDEDGHVETATKVTELTAESYACCARIYLLCRLLRRPREDPEVQQNLKLMLPCIDRCPSFGPLFTAQTPLFSVFIAGIVAISPEDRRIIEKWFVPVIEGARGCVPPAQRGLQCIWDWIDSGNLAGSERDEAKPWWERMCDTLYKQEGRLNLS